MASLATLEEFKASQKVTKGGETMMGSGTPQNITARVSTCSHDNGHCNVKVLSTKVMATKQICITVAAESIAGGRRHIEYTPYNS